MRALPMHLVGLAVSIAFFLYMGGYRLLQTFAWSGRTTGAVTVTLERGPNLPLSQIARSCETYFFYRPGGQTLEGSAHLFTPCLEAGTNVTLAFNPAAPTRAVPLLSSGQEWFYLSLGILLLTWSVYFTIASQVSRRPIVPASDPWAEDGQHFSHFYGWAWRRMMQDRKKTTRRSTLLR
ncbi:hypothetical protein ABYF32_04445 [Buchananella felis]|uniref:hypothetical protein n=1 Tax=Buchananella felis TaxID=3231492 RepID=UPI00352815E9